MSITLIAFAALCLMYSATSAQIRINEISPANASLVDEDSEPADWIELYNAGAEPVRLKQYRIGDKSDKTRAWLLPDTTIAAGGYLLVRASGKDKAGVGLLRIEGAGAGINPWNTWDAFRYVYLPVQEDFDFSMRLHSFHQSAAFACVGIMLTDEVRTDNLHSAIFVTGQNAYVFSRRSERMKAPERQTSHYGTSVNYPYVWLRLQRRKDSVFAYTSRFGDDWQLLDSSEFRSAGGGYVGIAIASADMQKSVHAIVTDIALNTTPVPLSSLEAADVGTVVPGAHYESREAHTHFKLDSGGETVYLWDAAGRLLDSMTYTMADTDMSSGRDGSDIVYFVHSTPGAANSTGQPLLQGELFVDPPGGRVAAGTVVRCSTSASGVQIRYTLDGSIPTQTSPLYQKPLLLDSTAIVRVRLWREGYYPTRTQTYTYLINEPATDLPVFSLVSDPALFWSDSAGIMSMGPDASPVHPFHGANFWKDWEIPCTIQMFENSSMVFSVDAGVKLQGRGSRVFPQKPIRIAARDRYGNGSIAHPLFPSSPLASYENVILRNGGQDWPRTLLRDPLLSLLALGIGLDARAYRPVRAYLDGRYWGLYNLRERVDEHFLSDYYNIPADSIQLMETVDVLPVYGERSGYCALIDTLETLDMEDAGDYAFMENVMDMENYIDYNCLEIYSANMDWPSLNIQYWRSPHLDNKWRWIVYDGDGGFGVDGRNTEFNSIEHLTSPVQQLWSNPPNATLLFRRLLENNAFKYAFLNRSADLLNTSLHSTRVEALIDSLVDDIAAEIPFHQQRWDTLYTWPHEVGHLRDFAKRRPTIVRTHYVKKFGLSGTARVTLNVAQPGSGMLRFSTVLPDALPWSGVYFKDVPITATAVAAPGYRFVRWATPGVADSSTVTIILEGDMELTAVFAPEEEPEDHGVVINEIMYKPSDERDSKDWIELYNGSGKSVDLSGWVLKDEDDEHVFVIPSGTVVGSEGYVVLCNSEKEFVKVYGSLPVLLVGDVAFGFGTPSDAVRLYDAFGMLVDSVKYTDKSPWPVDASGTGRSIELLHPGLDNSLGINWRSSVAGGTPGEKNGTGTAVRPGASVEILDLSCFPSPAFAGVPIHVRCGVAIPGHLTFSIADASGKIVATVPRSYEYSTGEHMVVLSTEGFLSGMYFLRATLSAYGRDIVRVLPFVVIK